MDASQYNASTCTSLANSFRVGLSSLSKIRFIYFKVDVSNNWWNLSLELFPICCQLGK